MKKRILVTIAILFIGLLQAQQFIPNGFYSQSGVIDDQKTNTQISGSVFAVKKQHQNTLTQVAMFIDMVRSNMDEATSAQSFGLVSRVVNTSDETNRGLIGANLVGRQSGEGDLEFVYGSITQADVLSESTVQFVSAETLRTNITGSASSMITNARSIGTDLVMDNVNTNITNLQAMHPSIQLTNGTVEDVTNLFLDLDYDNTGSVTVTGDIAYIRAGNDPLPTPTGNTWFIKSEVTHPSEFAGSITATNFIGNFDGQNSAYYNPRSFGLGSTVYTATAPDLNDTSLPSGLYRFSASATGNPVGSSGSLINLKSGATDYITQFAHFINAGDTKRIFIRHYSPALDNWATWAEVLHTENLQANAVLPTGFYEDLTAFTPTLVDNGGGATYTATTSTGNYYRVGNIVHFTMSFIGINTVGTPSGELRLTGLPYNISSNLENVEIVNLRNSNISSTDIALLVARVTTNYSTLYNKTNANNASSVTFTNGVLTISGRYSVNQY